MRLVRIAAAAAGVTAALAASDTPDVAPYTLAVIRQDGIVVPFTTWDGRKFGNGWPAPAKQAEAPITLEDVPRRWWQKLPPITSWHVWLSNGSRSEVETRAPAVLPVHCMQTVGLRTTLALEAPPPPLKLQPYPKIGLASSRRLEFQPVGVMATDSPVSKVLQAQLAALVAKEEETEIRGLSMQGWKHPYESEARASVPLTIEALYRSPLEGGRFLHYYEAVKRYTKARAEGSKPAAAGSETGAGSCAAITFSAGWFTTGLTDTKVVLGEGLTRISSCDYANVDVMLPLASLRQSGRTLWIVQFSSWDREIYQVQDPLVAGEQSVLAATMGGACPNP